MEGQRGFNGSQGPQGPQGVPGAQGPQGPQGTQGGVNLTQCTVLRNVHISVGVSSSKTVTASVEERPVSI